MKTAYRIDPTVTARCKAYRATVALVGLILMTSGNLVAQPAAMSRMIDTATTSAAAGGGAEVAYSEMMKPMQAMHQTMMTMHSSGDADKDFVMMMAPHHQAAVDMARAYMKHGRVKSRASWQGRSSRARRKKLRKCRRKWLGSMPRALRVATPHLPTRSRPGRRSTDVSKHSPTGARTFVPESYFSPSVAIWPSESRIHRCYRGHEAPGARRLDDYRRQPAHRRGGRPDVGLETDRVMAEVLPEGKANQVRKFREQGKVIGMIKGGINDAPAPARADVGIATGTGTDIAMEVSDLTLVRGGLHGVVEAIALCLATYRTIRQNLFWEFFYDVIGIAIAAGVLYHYGMVALADSGQHRHEHIQWLRRRQQSAASPLSLGRCVPSSATKLPANGIAKGRRAVNRRFHSHYGCRLLGESGVPCHPRKQ